MAEASNDSIILIAIVAIVAIKAVSTAAFGANSHQLSHHVAANALGGFSNSEAVGYYLPAGADANYRSSSSCSSPFPATATGDGGDDPR